MSGLLYFSYSVLLQCFGKCNLIFPKHLEFFGLPIHFSIRLWNMLGHQLHLQASCLTPRSPLEEREAKETSAPSLHSHDTRILNPIPLAKLLKKHGNKQSKFFFFFFNSKTPTETGKKKHSPYKRNGLNIPYPFVFQKKPISHRFLLRN